MLRAVAFQSLCRLAPIYPQNYSLILHLETFYTEVLNYYLPSDKYSISPFYKPRACHEFVPLSLTACPCCSPCRLFSMPLSEDYETL